MYPLQNPSPKDDDRVIMYRAGQRAVVEYIKAKQAMCRAPKNAQAEGSGAASRARAPSPQPPAPSASAGCSSTADGPCGLWLLRLLRYPASPNVADRSANSPAANR